MEKFEMLYSICLDNKNISALLDIIREDIKLKESSIPKCARMIQDIMKENIRKLSRPPKNEKEFKEIVRFLNKLCINTIIDIVAKKYPELHINRRKQISKEQMRRDLDVWGERENHVQDRPYIRSRKEYDDDERFYSMKPNDIGVAAADDFGGYASAFGNHLITNIPAGQKQPAFNNPHERKGTSEIEQRYQQMLNERNYGSTDRQKPPTPDLTLDGSGEEQRRKKMLRKMQEEQEKMMNGMGGMMSGMMGSGMPNGMSGMTMDDPYASLLGAGAPSQNMGQINPFMGMGNPLMPLSSTTMIADQIGYNNVNSMLNNYGTGDEKLSIKSMQLQNDYEKKIAERRMVDIETNQPQTNNNNYGNQMSSMGMMSNMGTMGNIPMFNTGMQIPAMGMQITTTGMQMPTTGIQMPTTGMQMPNMGMNLPNMGMQMPNIGMQMTNIGMPSLGIPNMTNI